MSKPDLIIRNGTVVDGTGGPIRIADVVIRDGVVSDITESASTLATKEIDADGAWVTPGFIDPHTHLDAQLFWDPTGSTVCPTRCVTTVVTGNCGFGIAPCGDGAEEYLLRCLEAVEEIPYEATRRRRALRVEQLRVLPRRTRQPRSRRQRCGVGPTLTTAPFGHGRTCILRGSDRRRRRADVSDAPQRIRKRRSRILDVARTQSC